MRRKRSNGPARKPHEHSFILAVRAGCRTLACLSHWTSPDGNRHCKKAEHRSREFPADPQSDSDAASRENLSDFRRPIRAICVQVLDRRPGDPQELRRLSFGLAAAEDGRAGYQHVGARSHHAFHGIQRDAPVDLDPEVQPQLLANFFEFGNALHGARQEFLSAETWIHAHHQHVVHHGQHFFNHHERGRGIDDDRGLHAVIGDQLQCAVQVTARFHLHTDHVRTRGGEIGDELVRVLDHQVAVERQLRDRPNGFHDWRAKGDVGHKMTVHHVHVDDGAAATLGASDLVGQVRKVRGQDGKSKFNQGEAAPDRVGAESKAKNSRAALTGLRRLQGASEREEVFMEDLQLTPKETALVLIDLEHGIVGRDLAPNSGKEVVEQCVKLAEATRAAGGTVVYVHVLLHEIPHKPADKPMMKPGAPPPPPEASELVPEAGYQPSTDLLITKRQWDAFYGTDLHAQLQGKGVKTIFMAGIATNFGVESTARSALAQGYSVVFAEDAMTSMSKDLHKSSIEGAFPVIGRVRTTKKIVKALG